MILLFTDFGWEGPNLGQLKTVLLAEARDVPVLDLMHDAPVFDPRRRIPLSALSDRIPSGAVVLAVVDPGVGSVREAVALEADGRWFVGPDKGLLVIVARRAAEWRAYEIVWRPENLSSTVHGRDLFAPVAASPARGMGPGAGKLAEIPLKKVLREDWPDDLSEVIYIDRYGNAISGIRGENLSPKDAVLVQKFDIQGEMTFSDVPDQALFWYVNSHGLVEIACNKGRAVNRLNLEVGTVIKTLANQPVTAG
ncbi:MAG: SAM-dependent chlorinase/fluorinase [Rhodospirillaceae bacterium]